MTSPLRSDAAWDPVAVERRSTTAVCCAMLYGDPLIELLIGDSFHPGGVATTERLLLAAKLAPGSRVLDAGCGLGASARLAAREFGLRVDACDVSADAISRAERLAAIEDARVRFQQTSLLELPYRDGSFDAVLAECVLSTSDKGAALTEIRRVLVPGGVLLLSDMTTRDPSAPLPEPLASVLCLGQAWQPDELERSLPAAGFQIERCWDETSALVGLLDSLEARYRLLRSLSGDDALGMQIRQLAERLSVILPDAASDARVVFELARQSVADNRVGYAALMARAV